jgi:oligopeptide transport system permease protein
VRRLTAALGLRGTAGLLAVLALLALSGGARLWGLEAPGALCPPDWELPRTATTCSRTVLGLARSVGVGLTCGGTAALLALLLASLGTRYRGWVDVAVARTAEVFFAVPDLLVLIGIHFAVTLLRDARAGFDPSPFAVTVFSLTVVSWAAPTRMIQDRLRSLEEADFVQAAVALGTTRWGLVRWHLLPFAWDYVMAIFLMRVPATILAESTVSFLGFGGGPDEASLGGYIGRWYGTLLSGDLHLVPALVLLATLVVAFQWLGQAALARTGAGR